MAYYDALIAKWAQAPAGTNDQKLAWVNAQTATGPAVPMIVSYYELYNRIDRSEYEGLAATKQQSGQRILNVNPIDFGPASEARRQMLSLFPVATKTQQNLKPFTESFDKPTIPWAQSAGYPVPITPTMLVAAGLIPPGITTPLP